MTLLIRQSPLPGPVEYSIDGATEAAEIDACTSSTLRLYGDPATLEEIVGKPLTEAQIIERREMWARGQRPETVPRAQIARHMMAHADDILVNLDERRRGALIYDGLRGVRFSISTMCEVYSNWALTDTIEGGSMERFKEANEIRLDRFGRPYRRTYRKLCSPSFIRRYIRHSRELDTMRVSTTVLLRRLNAVPVRCVRNDPEIWADMDAQLAAFVEHRKKQVAEEERIFWRNAIPADPRATPKADPKRRKILKRASAIASSVLGVAAVNALARGEKIKVDGPTLSIEMKKRGMLSDVGHGGLSVSLVDHSGVLLADLCIYQDSIPVIDQAVGFALMVQSGLEKEFVDEANIIRTTPSGEANPMVVERYKKSLAANIINTPLHMRGRWSYDQEREWSRKYLAATRPVWVDVMTTALLGRSRKTVEAILA